MIGLIAYDATTETRILNESGARWLAFSLDKPLAECIKAVRGGFSPDEVDLLIRLWTDDGLPRKMRLRLDGGLEIRLA